jgi:fumarate reductase subunit D
MGRSTNADRVRLAVGSAAAAVRVQHFLHGRDHAGLAVSAYVAALAILWAAIFLRLQNFDTLTSSAIGSVAFALAFLLPFICFSLVLIGTWQSLRRAKKGSSALGRNVAELAQLGVLATAVLTVLWATFDVPKSFRAISNARELLREPQWGVHADGYELRVTGPIDVGLFPAVDKALADNPAIRIVVLDSPGGDVDEAMRVAAMVKLRRLSTGVNRDCSSACTIIFAAGTERILLPSGTLGFHGCRDALAYFPCRNSAEENLLVTYGVDRAFVHKALAIAPESIWFPTPAELLAAHVITSTTVVRYQ